jgi:hypothetical protein
MAVVNGPGTPKLSVGKRTRIGSIATATDILNFAMSEYSGYHLGSLIVQAVPIGGTVTTFTANMQFSLDGGVTFATQFGTTPATIASTTSAMDFIAHPLQNIAIPGFGGDCSFQLAAATFVLGTGTRADIWMLVA